MAENSMAELNLHEGEEYQTYQCFYQGCLHKGELVSSRSSRVEVKSYVPQKKCKFSINWDEGAEASFHLDCWDLLVRESQKASKESALCQEEQQMIREAKQTAEFFNSDEEIKEEGKRIALMIRNAKHATIFTGAGISTSAGIGDFRGKGGKWTERDRKQKYGAASSSSSLSVASKSKPAKKKGGFSYENLRPTYTHEAIVKLVEMGLIKYVISQNCDGLHSLSGLPADKISELHGNTFHEKCEDCGTRYERTYMVGSRSKDVPPKACSGCRINHRTGRRCEKPGCQGYLMNTIINFGDNLESSVLSLADKHCREKDLMLCLGSSLTVTPASDLVMYGKKPVQLVICNRQPTQYDAVCEATMANGSQAGSRIYGDCDHMMREVMRNILDPGELQTWENGRELRMKEYAKLRT